MEFIVVFPFTGQAIYNSLASKHNARGFSMQRTANGASGTISTYTENFIGSILGGHLQNHVSPYQ